MDNVVRVFENQKLGSIRTIEIDSVVWFVGKDVATILGYAKPRNAIAAHGMKRIKRTPQFRAGLVAHR